jgi:hypothetical protein
MIVGFGVARRSAGATARLAKRASGYLQEQGEAG